ncbi:LANO_0G13674g1_1 [Lachancea nothofagi CBS 11611]|uniref:LANO_0G13674g1_1 n=1 Tax=Lachancea nothofagi CBS 11611 TaxID=1266666 RepID=A0A1G4KK20_9SACH|nr:LANO_0G13674g1_1 [Lachancea nothofagi CBS 11611]
MLIKEVALDLTNFVLSNVNDAISFKPQLCYQVPAQDYVDLRERYIAFTGTSMRKNKSRLYFLPTNISDELQQLNPSIPDSAKHVLRDGHVYYKNRLITELDYENVKRVELACAYIAYATVNKAASIEVETDAEIPASVPASVAASAPTTTTTDPSDHLSDRDDSLDGAGPQSASDLSDTSKLSPAETTSQALRRGGVIGFRELGYLVNITPWHFHRVFKVITGLTIREYGQLCSEFAKKNRDVMNACNKRVQELKAQGYTYHCFDDPDFLKEGSLCYEPTHNVVLLPQYFIDPNKSKEHKKKQKEVKVSDGKCTQRVEARKRRSSVMSGRIRAASQSSINSNNSIQDALQLEPSCYPSTPQLSPTDLNHSVSTSPVINSASEMSSRNNSLVKTSMARSRKGSINPTVTNLPQSSGKVGKPTRPNGAGGTSNMNHFRHMSDPSIALATNGLKNVPLDNNSNDSTATTNFVSQNPVTSPKIDFKFDIFGKENNLNGFKNSSHPSDDLRNDGDSSFDRSSETRRTASSLTNGSSSNNGGFQLDFNDDIPPNGLEPHDSGVYSIGMHPSTTTATTSIQGNSRSNESLPRGSTHTLLGDLSAGEFEDNNQLMLDLNSLNDNEILNQSYGMFDPKNIGQSNIHNSNSFTNLTNHAASYLQNEQLVTPEDQPPSSELQDYEQQQQQQQKYQQQQQQSKYSERSDNATNYSRNRLNSVAPQMDDLDRMFLSGHSGMTPNLGGHIQLHNDNSGDFYGASNSQPSTRDNTMGTMATTDTMATADTSGSTRDFDAKDSLASFTNLGFDVLSPCTSPTDLDTGLPIFDGNIHNNMANNNNASIEALMSADINDTIGNGFDLAQ